MIEAVATGLPIIAPFYSGHTEFLKHIESSVLKIDYQINKIDDPEFKKFWPCEDENAGFWVDINVISLLNLLKISIENFENLKKCALINSQKIQRNFSWNQSTCIALNSLIIRRIFLLD